MPKGKDIYGVVGQFLTVEGHVAGIAERNYQLTQFGSLRQRPANIRGGFQQQQLLFDSLAGPPGGFGSFGSQEPPASLQAADSALRDDYSWHSGAGFSSSVPQVFNQVRTSSPVR